MKEKKSFKTLLSLFLTFMKIGALTFGGGYAMIPIIHKEAVEKKKWVSNNDILDILAISESTPGPIAINTATYVGHTVMGFWGAFFATLGLVLPSFFIIFVISFFYKDFMKLKLISGAFKGLKAGVIILLFNAVLKLKKSVKFDYVAWITFGIALSISLLASIFDWKLMIGSYQLSISILLILFGLLFGLITTLINKKEELKQ